MNSVSRQGIAGVSPFLCVSAARPPQNLRSESGRRAREPNKCLSMLSLRSNAQIQRLSQQAPSLSLYFSLSLLLFIFSLFLSFFLSILCLCLSIFFCFLLSVFIVVVLDWNDLIPIPVWEMFMICIVFVSSRSSDWRSKSICVCWFDWFKCIATTNLLLEKKRETKLENDARRMENGSGGGREGREGGRMNSVGQRSSSALWSAVIPVITADISWFWVVFRGGFYFLLIFIFFLFLFTVLAFDGTQRIPVSNFFLRVFLILSFRLISSSCLMFSTRPQASTASLRDTYFICFLTLLHPPWNYNSWPLDAHRCNLATMDVSFIWYMINCRVIRELVIHFQVDRISI